jgi:hypothetical protein
MRAQIFYTTNINVLERSSQAPFCSERDWLDTLSNQAGGSLPIRRHADHTGRCRSLPPQKEGGS